MIELQPGAIDFGRAPVPGVRDKRIAEGELFADLETGVGTHTRFVAAAEAVSAEVVRSHERKQQRAVSDEIARQAEIEQGHATASVAVIHPLLRRKLNASGPLDRSEWNLLHVASILDRRREKRLVTDVFLVVQQFGLNVDAAHAGVEPDTRRKSAVRQRVRDAKLGEDRAVAHHSICSLVVDAELRRAGLRHSLPVRHRNVAPAVEAAIQFPQIAFVHLTRHHVGRTAEGFPLLRLVEQTRHGAIGEVERDTVILVLDDPDASGLLARFVGSRRSRVPGNDSVSRIPERRHVMSDE